MKLETKSRYVEELVRLRSNIERKKQIAEIDSQRSSVGSFEQRYYCHLIGFYNRELEDINNSLQSLYAL